MLRRFIVWVVGEPPTAASTREERLRWTRRFYRLVLIALAIVVILAAVSGSRFLWVLAAVAALMWVGGMASSSLSIRRARSRQR